MHIKYPGACVQSPGIKACFFIGGCISDDSGGRLCYTGEVILTPFPAFSGPGRLRQGPNLLQKESTFMAKTVPVRSEIPQEFTWNLTDLFPSDEAWQAEYTR